MARNWVLHCYRDYKFKIELLIPLNILEEKAPTEAYSKSLIILDVRLPLGRSGLLVNYQTPERMIMLSGVLDPTGYTAGEERNAGDTGTLLGMQCS